jgi:hypothetical protein
LEYLIDYWKDFLTYPVETFWEFKEDIEENKVAWQTFILNLIIINVVLGLALSFTTYPDTMQEHFLTFAGKTLVFMNGFLINLLYIVITNILLVLAHFLTIKLSGIDLYFYEARNMVFIGSIAYLSSLAFLPFTIFDNNLFSIIRILSVLIQISFISLQTYIYTEENNFLSLLKYFALTLVSLVLLFVGIIAFLSMLRYLPTLF